MKYIHAITRFLWPLEWGSFRRALRHPESWGFAPAIIYHLGLGVFLLIWASASDTNALFGVESALRTDNHYIIGMVLIFIAAAAICAIVIRNSKISIKWCQLGFVILILPQQATLIASAWGSIYQITKRYRNKDITTALLHYHVGHHAAHEIAVLLAPELHRLTDPPTILSVQWITISLAIAHTLIVGAVYRRKPR